MLTSVALLLAAAAGASAQAFTNTPPIECGADIVVDDFTRNITGALPGETLIRQLNLLGGDYGNVNTTMTIDTAAHNAAITAGPNPTGAENYWFAKFDAGACFNLTAFHAIAFDLTAPTGSSFSMTLTQKNADCVLRTPGNSDSSYIPITKYITPNGQTQRVTVPFVDFKTNLAGGNYDFVHLKDWTLIGFQPLNTVFTFANIHLVRSCHDNGPLGVNATLSANGVPQTTASSSAPSASGSSSSNPQANQKSGADSVAGQLGAAGVAAGIAAAAAALL